MQFAVAGPVTRAAGIMQLGQQARHALELFEARNDSAVTGGGLKGGVLKDG